MTQDYIMKKWYDKRKRRWIVWLGNPGDDYFDIHWDKRIFTTKQLKEYQKPNTSHLFVGGRNFSRDLSQPRNKRGRRMRAV